MSRAEGPVEYLSVEDLLDLARALGVGPVRDLGLPRVGCCRQLPTGTASSTI